MMDPTHYMLGRTRLSHNWDPHLCLLLTQCVGWGRGPTSLSHLLLRMVLTSQKGFVGFLYKKNKVVLLLTPKHHRITNVNRLCFYFGTIK